MKSVKTALFSTMSAALLVFGLAMFASVNAQHGGSHPTGKTPTTPPTASTPQAKGCCGGTDGKPGCCSSEACAKAQAAGHTSATASATTTGCRCCGDSCPLAKPATTTSTAHASMSMAKPGATATTTPAGDSGCPCCGDSCQKPKPAAGGATATTEGDSCCSGNDSCCAKPATPPTTTTPPKGGCN